MEKMQRLFDDMKSAMRTITRVRRSYEKIGVRYDLMTARLLYRHQMLAHQLLSDAMLDLLGEPDIGKTVGIWRNRSLKQNRVTRKIISEISKKGDYITVASVHGQIKEDTSLSTVKTAFRDGLDLGLLKQNKAGYYLTDKCIEGLHDRLTSRITRKSVVNFARFVCMIDDHRKFSFESKKLDYNKVWKEKKTVLERVADNEYFD